MKHLYFIRHGESEFNVANKWAGTSDPPLTSKGHEQAKAAGRHAKRKGISFDVIISSPLQRAHHTAKHIANELGYSHENIELNDLLMERHYGVLEGKVNEPGTDLWHKHGKDESIIDEHEGAEKLHELQERADKILDYLKSLEHETVLVVAHGATGRALYRSVNNLPINVRDVRYKNADLVKLI